jgi:hypothetical protein
MGSLCLCFSLPFFSPCSISLQQHRRRRRIDGAIRKRDLRAKMDGRWIMDGIRMMKGWRVSGLGRLPGMVVFLARKVDRSPTRIDIYARL